MTCVWTSQTQEIAQTKKNVSHSRTLTHALAHTQAKLTFIKNGHQVPGAIDDIPLSSAGCDGLVLCVCLGGVGDVVRLQDSQEKSFKVQRTLSQKRGSAWGTWAPGVRVAGNLATNTKDECGCVAHSAGVKQGRHVTEIKIQKDMGGLFLGVVTGDVPLYRTWTDCSLVNRVWYRTYYGSTRSGDATLSKGGLEYQSGDVLSIDLDMDQGQVRFLLNGKAAGERERERERVSALCIVVKCIACVSCWPD